MNQQHPRMATTTCRAEGLWHFKSIGWCCLALVPGRCAQLSFLFFNLKHLKTANENISEPMFIEFYFYFLFHYICVL